MRAIGIVATCALLAAAPAACGGDDGDSNGAGGASYDGGGPSDEAARQAGANERAAAERAARKRLGAAVQVRKSRYGNVIFDGKGRALYLFTRERSSRSRCYGACAVAWPPFLTRGKPRAGNGVEAGLLGTTKRRDGKTQVTYRGQPLYYYVTDRRPGQITCHDVAEFGGTWLVVAPDGRPVS